MAHHPVAYSYARISSKRQERGSGIQRQLRQSREYAERNELLLDETLQDIGISAFDGANIKKGALGNFLKLIQDGRIPHGSYLLVESLDRISRDKIRSAMPLLLDIINSGITIVALSDSERIYNSSAIDNDPLLLFGSLMTLVRGHEESQLKSHRIRSWWRKEIQLARTQPGHKVKGQNPPGWLNADWSRNEPIIATVRQIFDLAAIGVGQHAIAKHLNRTGAPVLCARRRSGDGWYQSAVASLMNDRRVLGEWQPTISGSGGTLPDGPPIKGYMEAIIPSDLFQRVQGAKNSLNRDKVATNKGRITNLFTGRIRCNCCGGSMTIVPNGSVKSRKNVSIYLTCSNKKRQVKVCPSRHMFNYGHMEKALLDNLLIIPWGKITNAKEKDVSDKDIGDRIEMKQRDIERLSERSDNLAEAISIGGKLAPLLKKLAMTESDLSLMQIELREMQETQSQYRQTEVADGKKFEDMLSQRSAVLEFSGERLYSARAMLSAMLRPLVPLILLDGVDNSVMVWIGEEYRLQWRAGKDPFVWHRPSPLLPPDAADGGSERSDRHCV